MLRIIGHRGAAGLAPENTVAAIRKGLQHNVDEIEIDARVTQDGVVVVHHDPEVHDQTGAGYIIREQTFAVLTKHKPDLATLEQAIEAVGRAVPLQIEVKRGEPLKPVVAVLEKYLSKDWTPQDFLLGSKSQKILIGLHHALPAIPKVVIEPFSGVRASWRLRQLNQLSRTTKDASPATRVSMRATWLWSGFIRSVQRSGNQLYAYTLNDPAKAHRWERYGLAGVITDYPDLFDHARTGPPAKTPDKS